MDNNAFLMPKLHTTCWEFGKMPETVKELYSRALDLEVKGMRREALATYESVLALDPNHFGATNGRNRVHRTLLSGVKSVEQIDGIIEIDIERAKEKISGYDYPVSNELLLRQYATLGENDLSVFVYWLGDVSEQASTDGSWVSSDGYLNGGYRILVTKGHPDDIGGKIDSGSIVYDKIVYPSEEDKSGHEIKSMLGPLVRIKGLWPSPICNLALSAKQEKNEEDQIIRYNPVKFVSKVDPWFSSFNPLQRWTPHDHKVYKSTPDYSQTFKDIFSYTSWLSGVELGDLYIEYLRGKSGEWQSGIADGANLTFIIDYLKNRDDPRWIDAVFLYLGVDSNFPDPHFVEAWRDTLNVYAYQITGNHIISALNSKDTLVIQGAIRYSVLFPNPAIYQNIMEILEKDYGLNAIQEMIGGLRSEEDLIPTLGLLHTWLEICRTATSNEYDYRDEFWGFLYSFGKSICRFGVKGVKVMLQGLSSEPLELKSVIIMCLSYLGSYQFLPKDRGHLKVAEADGLVKEFSMYLSSDGIPTYPIEIEEWDDETIEKWNSCSKKLSEGYDSV